MKQTKGMKRLLGLILAILMVAGSLVPPAGKVSAAETGKKAVNGAPTVKVGMEIEVVDQSGDPVKGVEFTVNYDGQAIKVGPSDENGIARSAPDAFQLYNKSNQYVDYGDAFKQSESVTITMTTIPDDYKNPEMLHGVNPDDPMDTNLMLEYVLTVNDEGGSAFFEYEIDQSVSQQFYWNVMVLQADQENMQGIQFMKQISFIGSAESAWRGGKANLKWQLWSEKKQEYVDIVIDKKDLNSEEPLEGVVFDIINNSGLNLILQDGKTKVGNGQVAGSITTDAAGHGSLSGLPKVDHYIIRERKAKPGYEKGEDIKLDPTSATESETLSITANPDSNDVYTLSVSNKKITSVDLEIEKVEAGNPSVKLSGVTFEIINNGNTILELPSGQTVYNRSVVAEAVTDEQGKAVFTDLPLNGKYLIREKDSVPGYKRLTEEIPFIPSELTPDQAAAGTRNALYKKTIENTKDEYVEIEIEKYDKEDPSIKLGGAVFGVYNASSKSLYLEGSDTPIPYRGLVGEITTDVNGKGKLGGIPKGAYIYLQEITAPTGYNPLRNNISLDTAREEPTVAATPTTVAKYVLPVEESKIIYGGVKLTKVDYDDKSKKLEGAVFELRNNSSRQAVLKDGTVIEPNALIGEYTTDANGEIVIPSILPDTVSYKMIEKTPPKGYHTKGLVTQFTFSIKEQDYQHIITCENKSNEPSYYKIIIDKIGEVVSANGKDIEYIPLKGAVLAIVNASKNPVKTAEGKTYQPGETIYTMDLTDATTGETPVIFPMLSEDGEEIKYNIYETTIPDGFTALGWSQINYKYPQWEKTPLVNTISFYDLSKHERRTTVQNHSFMGIEVVKEDYEDSSKKLQGVEFDVIVDLYYDGQIEGDGVVTPDGKFYGDGAVIAKLKTDENGRANTGDILPQYTMYGHSLMYRIKETVPPQGYMAASDSLVEPVFHTTGHGLTRVWTIKNKKAEFGHITITKTDFENNQPISGAKFSILLASRDAIRLKNGKVVQSGEEVMSIDMSGKTTFRTDDILPIYRANGDKVKYRIVETQAPDGYSIRTETKEVNAVPAGDTEKVETIPNNRKRYDLLISKTAAGKTEEMAEVSLHLVEVRGESELLEYSWIHTGLKVVSLRFGEHKLVEIKAPEGYGIADPIKFSVTEDGKVLINGKEAPKKSFGGVEYPVVHMENKLKEYDVSVSKTALGQTEELEGAELSITGADADGNAIEAITWTSDGNAKIVKLAAGSYTLTESKAPLGYDEAEAISFTVGKDGKIKVKGEEVAKVHMEDNLEKHEIAVSKTALGQTKELAGAQLSISGTDADGNAITEIKWTSDGNAKTVKLAAGSYTLTESKAPLGYDEAEAINFTVDKEGKIKVNGEEVLKVHMEDKLKFFDVSVSKTALGQTEELAGAQLRISGKDVNGKAIKAITWTSDGNAKTVKLDAGSYTLTESKAPLGYDEAEAINFTVDNEGIIKVNGEEVLKVHMEDKLKSFDVSVSKTALGQTEELAGAQLRISGKDVNGKAITEIKWTSDGNAKTVKLAAGTYTLTESKAPLGYDEAEAISFTVEKDGKVKVNGEEVLKVHMEDKLKQYDVSISKTALGQTEELKGAQLSISGKDVNGKAITEIKWTSDGNAKTVKLAAGSYTLTESKAPLGYVEAEAISFTVEKDGKVKVNGEEVLKVHMEDKLKQYDVSISKTALGQTAELKDAELSITGKDVDGKAIEEIKWTSDGNAKTVKLAAGSYTLTESKAPLGYDEAEAISFTVEKDGKVKVNGEEVLKVHMEDKLKQYDVSISKTALGQTAELKDAELSITGKDVDGKAIEEIKWTSDGTSKVVKLPAGEYTLTESKAPLGYDVAEAISFTVEKDGKVKVNGEEVLKVHMEDKLKQYDVSISKTALGQTEELKGAELSISGKDVNGKAITEIKWTSDGNAKTVKLAAGTYTLTESKAPDGYVIAESITFDVDLEGKVTVGGKTVEAVQMKDDHTKVTIKKTDITGTKEIGGAKLQIMDGDEIIEKWVSVENKSHEINAKLIAGKTYTLVETQAPDGYEVAEKISFTVNSDGTVKTVIMKDEKKEFEVPVSKVMLGQGNELEGAKLTVTGKDIEGKDISYAWESEGKAKTIILPAGRYTLTEVSAPDGYIKAESIDFEVTVDGSIKVGDAVETRIVMEDDYTKVTIKKTDITGTKEIGGAKLQIMDGDQLIEEWISVENKSHEINAKLIAGKTYTLVETQAPDGYEVAEAISFKVNEDGSIQVVTMSDALKNYEVIISKVILGQGKELAGASLEIKGINMEGDKIDPISWISTGAEHKVTLAAGTYTLTETSAPAGYVIAEKIAFEVAADGSVTVNGVAQSEAKVVMEDDYTKVVIRKTDITGTEEIAGARLQIKDGDTVIDRWTSEAGKSHEINAKLVAGKEYTLVEISAPAGYLVAEEITFTVNEDGTVQTITMKDDWTLIVVSKVDITSSKELPGATLQIIDSYGNVVEEWVSKELPHVILGLTVGEEYTLREIIAPDGYSLAADTAFVIQEDGSVISSGTFNDAGALLVENAPEETPEEDETSVINPSESESEEVKDETEQPSTEPSSESSPEESTESTTQPGTEPSSEESTEPITEAPTEPCTEESTEPITEAPTEPGTEPATEPLIQPSTGPEAKETEVPTEPSQTAPVVPGTTPAPAPTRPSQPDTGDHSHIGLYIGMLGFAALGTGLLVGRRKKDEAEE